MRYNRSMPERILSWVFFYIFVGILVAAAVTLFFPGRGVLLSALMPRAERFTELYFEKHLELPKKASFNTTYPFSVVIHNLEGRPFTYQLEAIAQDESSPIITQTFYKADVTLGSRETRVIPMQLRLPAIFSEKVKISIFLRNVDQSIHFWTETPLLIQPAAGSAEIATPSSIIFVQ